MRHEILVYNETSRKIPRKFIINSVLLTLAFLKLKQPVELAVLVVSGVKIRKLNKFWRGEDKAADELSFGLNSRKTTKLAKNENKVLELGEIVVNGEKISDKNHLKIILIHGLLHLLGYNHEKSKTEAQKMEQLELKILKNFRF